MNCYDGYSYYCYLWVVLCCAALTATWRVALLQACMILGWEPFINTCNYWYYRIFFKNSGEGLHGAVRSLLRSKGVRVVLYKWMEISSWYLNSHGVMNMKTGSASFTLAAKVAQVWPSSDQDNEWSERAQCKVMGQFGSFGLLIVTQKFCVA